MRSIFVSGILWVSVVSLAVAQHTPTPTPAQTVTPTAAPSPTPAVTPSSNPVVTIQLTSDVVAFFKAAVFVAGAFVAVLAFIGVAFFGFDVRKARSSIHAAEDDARKTSKSAQELFEKIKTQHQQLSELERKVEEIAAQMEALIDTQPVQLGKRDESELLRDIIASSSFTWTTIGRLTKKTGLSRDKVLEVVRRTPGIEISTSKKTHDYIFRIRNGA